MPLVNAHVFESREGMRATEHVYWIIGYSVCTDQKYIKTQHGYSTVPVMWHSILKGPRWQYTTFLHSKERLIGMTVVHFSANINHISYC